MTGLRARRRGTKERWYGGRRSRFGGRACRARPRGGDAGEHLAEHLKHVQLSGVLCLSAAVFRLQPLLLHAVEAVLGLRTLLQELLHELLHGEVRTALPRPFGRSG